MYDAREGLNSKGRLSALYRLMPCRSALVYEAATRTMRHYDSSAGSGNAHSAKQLAQALKVRGLA